MSSHEFGSSPLSAHERLAAAKVDFRNYVLQDDTVFSIVRDRLCLGPSNHATPSFGLEPTLRRNKEDGTSIIGLRISRSGTVSDVGISGPIEVYDDFPLARIDTATGVAQTTLELTSTLAALCKEDAALDVIQVWQAGVRGMGAQFPDSLALDPMTDTFVVPE